MSVKASDWVWDGEHTPLHTDEVSDQMMAAGAQVLWDFMQGKRMAIAWGSYDLVTWAGARDIYLAMKKADETIYRGR